MNTAAQQYRKKMLKLKRHFVWLPKTKNEIKWQNNEIKATHHIPKIVIYFRATN